MARGRRSRRRSWWPRSARTGCEWYGDVRRCAPGRRPRAHLVTSTIGAAVTRRWSRTPRCDSERRSSAMQMGVPMDRERREFWIAELRPEPLTNRNGTRCGRRVERRRRPTRSSSRTARGPAAAAAATSSADDAPRELTGDAGDLDVKIAAGLAEASDERTEREDPLGVFCRDLGGRALAVVAVATAWSGYQAAYWGTAPGRARIAMASPRTGSRPTRRLTSAASSRLLL